MNEVQIVFDGPPSHESGRFVEVEDVNGKSINFGRWAKRKDDYWALQFNTDAPILYPIEEAPKVGGTNILAWVIKSANDRGDIYEHERGHYAVVYHKKNDWQKDFIWTDGEFTYVATHFLYLDELPQPGSDR